MWTVDALALLINKVREKVDSLIVPTKVSDLVNDAGYVDAAGAAAAAPVQSVNGMMGTVVVNPITTWTPSSTATALQVIAHAQANPGLIFCWARFQPATYTPVSSSGAWTYTLYTNYSSDANYVIFEAENNSNGRLYRCDAFGDWRELARISDMKYVAGDTFTATGYVPLAGYVTDSAKMLRVAVPVAKSLANITNIAVTAFTGGVRTTDAGYLDGRNITYNWINSTYTITATKASDNLVMVELTKASAFSNVTTNTPVTFAAYPITLSFS